MIQEPQTLQDLNANLPDMTEIINILVFGGGGAGKGVSTFDKLG